MDIEIRKRGTKWVAEVWSDNEHPGPNFTILKEPDSEQKYQEINRWCVDTLKYHARTAYHVFEFKRQEDLEWFLLRWS